MVATTTNGHSRLVGPNGEPLPTMLLKHVEQFGSVWQLPSMSYRFSFDEALKRSESDALAMRRDLFVMKCVRARQRPVAKSKWHLDPEDPNDAGQRAVAQQMTDVLLRTPSLLRFRMCVQEAIWYGRYGVQMVRRRKSVHGQTRWAIHDWKPTNGDKITFRTTDGTPGIRIYAAAAKELEEAGGCVDYTDKGATLFLDNPRWRQRFAIHKHEIEDADYMESELAGGVHGVGIRHYIYWAWWLRQEVMGWLFDYLELMGAGGITVVGFPYGNATAEAKARSEFAKRANIVFLPMPMGTDQQATVVQRIEPSGTGNSILKEMVDGYFNAQIKEFILGQNLSSQSAPTGLGSGVAALQANTLQDILEYDAENHDETMTTDVVMPMTRMNFPGYPHMLHWRSEIRQPDVKAALEAAKDLHEMGLDLDEDELRGLSGLSRPKPGAHVLKGKSQMQAPGMPGMGGPNAPPGMPGAGPAPGGPPGQPPNSPLPPGGAPASEPNALGSTSPNTSPSLSSVAGAGGQPSADSGRAVAESTPAPSADAAKAEETKQEDKPPVSEDKPAAPEQKPANPSAPQMLEPQSILPVNKTDDAKVEQITAQMRQDGWPGRPLLAFAIDNSYQAITGSHRLAAAQKVGLKQVPVVVVDAKDLAAALGQSDPKAILGMDDEAKVDVLLKLHDGGKAAKIMALEPTVTGRRKETPTEKAAQAAVKPTPHHYAKDAAGHEHKGEGPGGGQFTSDGGSAKKAPEKTTKDVAKPTPKASKNKGDSSPKGTAKTRTPVPKLSEKAARAKAAHHMVDKTVQRYAEEHNEPRFAKAMGGASFPDSEAVDVAVPNSKGVVAHGIELKTMVDNKANKITMKRSAMERKLLWEKKNKSSFHTVVLDDSDVFQANGEAGDMRPDDKAYAGLHDDSKRKMFYRRGVGSFRVSTMHPVKNLRDLKRLLHLPDDQLPPAAQRTDNELRRQLGIIK